MGVSFWCREEAPYNASELDLLMSYYMLLLCLAWMEGFGSQG